MKLIKNENGYSVYENPDQALKAKIQAIALPDHIIEMGETWTFIGDAKNGDFIMESASGKIQTIGKNRYESLLVDTHLRLINEDYPIISVFNKHFAPFKGHGWTGGELVSMTPKYVKHPKVAKAYSNPVAVNSIFMVKEWGASKSTTAYINGTSTLTYQMKFSSGVRSGMMYFNREGDIVNRDYNYNFNVTHDHLPLEDSIETFLGYLSEHPQLEYINGKWFTDDYVFILESREHHGDHIVEVRGMPNQGSSYYPQGDSWMKVKKPNKKGEMVTHEHLAAAARVKVNELVKIVS